MQFSAGRMCGTEVSCPVAIAGERPHSSVKDVRQQHVRLCLEVGHDLLSHVVGRGGSAINQIRSATGAAIRANATGGCCIIEVSGRRIAVDSAMEALRERASPTSRRVEVPKRALRCIVGHGGAGVREIEEATGASVCIDTAEASPRSATCAVEVLGAEEQVERAEVLLRARARPEPLDIPGEALPALLGNAGAGLRSVQVRTGAWLCVPPAASGERSWERACRLELFGEPRARAAARALVEALVAGPAPLAAPPADGRVAGGWPRCRDSCALAPAESAKTSDVVELQPGMECVRKRRRSSSLPLVRPGVPFPWAWTATLRSGTPEPTRKMRRSTMDQTRQHRPSQGFTVREHPVHASKRPASPHPAAPACKMRALLHGTCTGTGTSSDCGDLGCAAGISKQSTAVGQHACKHGATDGCQSPLRFSTLPDSFTLPTSGALPFTWRLHVALDSPPPQPRVCRHSRHEGSAARGPEMSGQTAEQQSTPASAGSPTSQSASTSKVVGFLSPPQSMEPKQPSALPRRLHVPELGGRCAPHACRLNSHIVSSGSLTTSGMEAERAPPRAAEHALKQGFSGQILRCHPASTGGSGGCGNYHATVCTGPRSAPESHIHNARCHSGHDCLQASATPQKCVLPTVESAARTDGLAPVAADGQRLETPQDLRVTLRRANLATAALELEVQRQLDHLTRPRSATSNAAFSPSLLVPELRSLSPQLKAGRGPWVATGDKLQRNLMPELHSAGQDVCPGAVPPVAAPEMVCRQLVPTPARASCRARDDRTATAA